MPTTYLDEKLATKPLPLASRGLLKAAVHLFDEESILAVNAALAARRPLLVRGEPGTGKSQLARAAAQALHRLFVSKVVDVHTEARDLLWSFDAVARLAEAQLAGSARSQEEARVAREQLDESRFVAPGPLWWAFNAATARAQAELAGAPLLEGGKPGEGAVLLVDEIDKADAAVPNGLLEALGDGEFPVQGHSNVRMTGAPPLVIVTTNEERALPDAFLRRCLVRHLALPKDGKELIDLLVKRGKAHFQECADSVLLETANLLAKDRANMIERSLSPPGQAEYLDLLRAVTELATSEEQQLALLKRIAPFALRKHPSEA
jgi:MoxR-like ATPase